MKRTTFTITFDDGETRSASLMPILPATYIATVEPEEKDPSKFTGGYGIDWCEMDTGLSKIKSFQGIKESDISHVLDTATSQFKTGGTATEKQTLIKKLYTIETYHGKDYPVTWINLPQGKTATVTIKANLIKGTKEKTDYLTIVKNSNFEISHDKTTDTGNNPPIKLEKLNSKKGLNIEIKALNTYAQTEYINIKDYNGVDVGKIEMEANTIENLAIKIIPIVFKSNSTDEKKDAVKLYNAATNSGKLLKELNDKAFCQAGITCNIEPIKANPECIVVDVTKDNWKQFWNTTKKEFKHWGYPNTAIKPNTPSFDEDGEKRYHANDITGFRFLPDKFEDAYYAKYGKTYKGALIFVTDQNYEDPTFQGYSQTDPLRSQGIVIFNSGLKIASVYAHELSHMLGLEHTFFKDVAEISNTNTKLGKLTGNKSIADGKKEIQGYITHANKYLKEDQDAIKKIKSENSSLSQSNLKEIKKLETSIKDIEKNITRYKDNLRKININRVCNFKVTKARTKNYMDYINDRTYFAKHQVELAKKECKDFYK